MLDGHCFRQHGLRRAIGSRGQLDRAFYGIRVYVVPGHVIFHRDVGENFREFVGTIGVDFYLKTGYFLSFFPQDRDCC